MKKIISPSKNIKKDIQKIFRSIDIKKFIKPNDKVLIKPSCNSPDPFPATTDLKVIDETIRQIKKITPHIAIGESSGVLYKPTEKIFDSLGLTKLAKKYEIPLINFDNHKWIKKTNKNARYLKKVKLTEFLNKYNKIIYLPTLRTHRGAGFTASLKLGMGFAKVSERMKMHSRKLKPKIADLNLYFKPTLIIMDAREVFITDGPEKGEKRKPNKILLSNNRTSIDIEGLKILKKYNAEKLEMPVNEVPIIKFAREFGVE